VSSNAWDAMMERQQEADDDRVRKLAEQRERRHAQKILSQMSTKFFVETIRDSAGKMPPKAEDLLLEAARRLEALLAISGRSGVL
jgi:hypothetical protein